MSKQVGEAIEKSLRPAKAMGQIAKTAGKGSLLEKIAPVPPGGSPSVKRKILEKALNNKK